MTNASSSVTSFTRPREKPSTAPPPTSVSTMISRAVRLPIRRSLVAPEHQVNEFAEPGETGHRNPADRFHARRSPTARKTELRRLAEAQPVMRDLPHFARQRQFAKDDRVGGHRPFTERRDQIGRAHV